jgi:ABC-type dipeptide/oligopeptide/nickel transport system ATPase component
MNKKQEVSISLRDLKVRFITPGRTIHAVNGVDLEVGRGEVVALLGESGSGKSVTLRAIMRLHSEKTTQMEGGLDVEGHDVLKLSRRQLSDLRGKVVSMIFQEPLLSIRSTHSVRRLQRWSGGIRECPRLKPASERWRYSKRSVFQALNVGWMRIRTRCRAVCASVR